MYDRIVSHEMVQIVSYGMVQIVSPEFADNLRTGSVLYSFVSQVDFLNVGNLVTSLIGG